MSQSSKNMANHIEYNRIPQDYLENICYCMDNKKKYYNYVRCLYKHLKNQCPQTCLDIILHDTRSGLQRYLERYKKYKEKIGEDEKRL